jgi:phosphoglycerate kinase
MAVVKPKKLAEANIVRGMRVVLRANLNAPIENGHITDSFRIDEALKTIQHLSELGARTVIIGHSSTPGASLLPVYEEITKTVRVTFAEDPVSKECKKKVGLLSEGESVLFENLRKNPGEERNVDLFSRELASFGEIFVNDDFSSAHRPHASVVGIPKYLPSYMGLRFECEYENLSRAFNPEHPAVVVLGGSKTATKLPIALRLAGSTDHVFIAGVSGSVLLQAKGRNIGQSVVDVVPNSIVRNVLAQKNITTYSDVLVVDSDGDELVVSADHVMEDNTIVDAGPETTASIVEAISRAAFVLWNGPLGWYEKGYITATHEVARAIARSNAYSVVGGGDTRIALKTTGVEKEISFYSTAGGAMLEFLSNKTLPGIEALV